MSCRLNPWESVPEVVQGPGRVTTSPTLLDLGLMWSQQNYLKLLLTVGYRVTPPKKNQKSLNKFLILIIPLSFSGCSSDLVHEILQQ